MILGLLGMKLNMTQMYYKGQLMPVTNITCGPCVITQIKNNSIQIGYNIEHKINNIKKPLLGHFNKYHLSYFKYLTEYKTIKKFEIGQQLNVNLFTLNSLVNITGISIGKGFAGNIKRNHFQRGPMSHGSKHHRLQGSIGAGTTPGRVIPGKKMSGHMGNQKTTIKNLMILNINSDNNLISVKGCVPGSNNNLVNIKINEL